MIVLPILLVLGMIQSCTDVIQVDLPDGETLLVVDAWVNNIDQLQIIKLTYTVPYFDITTPPATGAMVTIIDNNNVVYVFVEEGTSGEYIWQDTSTVFGTIGDSYELTITIDGGVYKSSSTMNRVPDIDSFSYEVYEPFFNLELKEEGWEAQFHATDFDGVGDTYWIKAFKNDLYLNKPQELSYAYDAGFSGGSEIDGIPFIEPLRASINRIPDLEENGDDTAEYPPYDSGDKIKVELHSMTNSAYEFLNETRNQLTLGDNTIFAPPLVNVPSNIEMVSGSIKAVGCFNVAAVSVLEEFIP